MTNAKYSEIEKKVHDLIDKSKIHDEKLAQIDTRLTLLEYQVVAIVQDLERKAKKIVDENKISNIVPQPAKGEEEYLKSLLKDKIVEPWKINLDKVREKTLDGLVDLIADSVIKVYRWNSENKKISDADHETFLKSFIDKLVDSSFAGDSNSNPKLMGVEAGVKALVIAGKYMIAKSEEQKKVKELEEYWAAEMQIIKSEIKKYLKDESEEGFKKMLNDFCNLYKINFDRDDFDVYSLFSFVDSWSYDDIKKIEKIGIRDFITGKSYTYCDFKKSFKNIPGYIHTVVDSKKIFELKKIYESLDNKDCFPEFDIKNYTKNEISEDELQKLNSQFRLYRAIKKTGEFNYQSNSNDVFYKLQEGFVYTNHTFGMLPMILLFPYIAIPTYLGGRILSNNLGADENLLNERYFRENISSLTENMRKCMFGFSSEILNEVLKKREILSHIKIFADVTGSKYAQNFYQECLKDSYAGIKNKELFDELYDLYSKLTNTGLANPENHYKYSFQLQKIESTEIENPALKFVLSAIERNKKKAQGLFDQAVNDNAANDQSFLFGSSQVAKTALNAGF